MRVDLAGNSVHQSLDRFRGWRGHLPVLAYLDVRGTKFSLAHLQALSQHIVLDLRISMTPCVQLLLQNTYHDMDPVLEIDAQALAIIFVMPRVMAINGQLVPNEARQSAKKAFLSRENRTVARISSALGLYGASFAGKSQAPQPSFGVDADQSWLDAHEAPTAGALTASGSSSATLKGGSTSKSETRSLAGGNWLEDAMRVMFTSQLVPLAQGGPGLSASHNQKAQASQAERAAVLSVLGSSTRHGTSTMDDITDCKSSIMYLASHCSALTDCLVRERQVLRGMQADITRKSGACPWFTHWNEEQRTLAERRTSSPESTRAGASVFPGSFSCYPLATSALLHQAAPSMHQFMPVMMPPTGAFTLQASAQATVMGTPKGGQFSTRDQRKRMGEGVLSCAPLLQYLWLASHATVLDLLCTLESCSFVYDDPAPVRAALWLLSERAQVTEAVRLRPAGSWKHSAREADEDPRACDSVGLTMTAALAVEGTRSRTKANIPARDDREVLRRRLVLCYKWIAGLPMPAIQGFCRLLRFICVDLPCQDTSLDGTGPAAWFLRACKMKHPSEWRPSKDNEASLADAMLLAASSCIHLEQVFNDSIWSFPTDMQRTRNEAITNLLVFAQGGRSTMHACAGFQAVRPKQSRSEGIAGNAGCEAFVQAAGRISWGSTRARADCSARWLRERGLLSMEWDRHSLLGTLMHFLRAAGPDQSLLVPVSRPNASRDAVSQEPTRLGLDKSSVSKRDDQSRGAVFAIKHMCLRDVLLAYLNMRPSLHMNHIKRAAGVVIAGSKVAQPPKAVARRPLALVQPDDVVLLRAVELRPVSMKSIRIHTSDVAAVGCEVETFGRYLAVRVQSVSGGPDHAVALEHEASLVRFTKSGLVEFEPLQENQHRWYNRPPFFGSRLITASSLKQPGEPRVPSVPLVWSHISVQRPADTSECLAVVWEAGQRMLHEVGGRHQSLSPPLVIAASIHGAGSPAADDLVVFADPADIDKYPQLQQWLDSLKQTSSFPRRSAILQRHQERLPTSSDHSNGGLRRAQAGSAKSASQPQNHSSRGTQRLPAITEDGEADKQARLLGGSQQIPAVGRSANDARRSSGYRSNSSTSGRRTAIPQPQQAQITSTPTFEEISPEMPAADILGALFSDQDGASNEGSPGCAPTTASQARRVQARSSTQYSATGNSTHGLGRQNLQQPRGWRRFGQLPRSSPIRPSRRRRNIDRDARGIGKQGQLDVSDDSVKQLDPLTRARLSSKAPPVRGNLVQLRLAPPPPAAGASVDTNGGYLHEVIELPCVRGHFPSMVPSFPTKKPVSSAQAYPPHLRAERALDAISRVPTSRGRGKRPQTAGSGRLRQDPATHGPRLMQPQHYHSKTGSAVRTWQRAASSGAEATATLEQTVKRRQRQWRWRPQPPDNVGKFPDRPSTAASVRTRGVLVGALRSGHPGPWG